MCDKTKFDEKYINCEFVVEYENCYDNISEGNFEVVGVPE